MKKLRISSLVFFTYHIFLCLMYSAFLFWLIASREISFKVAFGFLFASALLYFLVAKCQHWAQIVKIGQGVIEVRTLLGKKSFKYSDIIEARQIEEIRQSRGPSPNVEVELVFTKSETLEERKPLRFVPNSKGTHFINTERAVHPVVNIILTAIPKLKFVYIYDGREISVEKNPK